MNRNVFQAVVVIALVVAMVSVSPVVFARPATGDSDKVSQLLSDVKTEAIQLRDDTQDLRNFSRSTQLSWESHTAKISQIKDHVNALGGILTNLRDAKASASPWQQQAIERITPLLQELATNTSKTIDHLSKNQNKVHMAPYQEYVAASAEVAESLTELISDYVEYGESKNRMETLGQKLEAPGH